MYTGTNWEEVLIMSFLNLLFGENKSITKPIFTKDYNKDNIQLKELQDLFEKLNDGEKKDIIEKDIILLRQGLSGENNVYYELKNSFLPMLCLHDIRVEYDDYVAQLEFVVITNKFLAILETKKLNGNILINRDGDFIRTMKNKYGKVFKEGIYSPVSQNKRHIKIVKDLLSKKLNINNLPLISLVVIANPKSIIDKDKCPNDIKYSIYKYDQIVNRLEKYYNDKKNEYNLDEKRMNEISNLFLNLNTPISFDNISKYGLCDDDFLGDYLVKTVAPKQERIPEPVMIIKEKEDVPYSTKDKGQLVEELKRYRLETSRLEGIPAYYIFNNAEMDDLVEKYPTSKEILSKVKGFGDKKVQKYGEDILKFFIS